MLRKRAFTIVELLVVIAIISILVAILLPAINSAREMARRVQCQNKLRQMGIAANSYLTTWGYFPMGRNPWRADGRNGHNWSQHSRMLAYIEELHAEDLIDLTKAPGNAANRRARETGIQFFICPTDLPDRMTARERHNQTGWGRNNYKANAGSDTGQVIGRRQDRHERNNGIFLTNEVVSIRDITDGVSKTALFSEAVKGDADVFKVEIPGDWFRISPRNRTADEVRRACLDLDARKMVGLSNQVARQGRNWVWGNYIPTRYNHVMEPNGRSCARQGGRGNLDANSPNNEGGATTASSRHPGGVNLCLGDATVAFIADDIDLHAWRAYGSRNGNEEVIAEL